MGIVIGASSNIGDYVTIHQNVTIGRKNYQSVCPIDIGNHVWISAGAVVLGPLTIGENALIGANSVVLANVEKNTSVVGAPAKVVARKTSLCM